MGISNNFLTPEPERAEIDRSLGPLLLEFGTSWCGHCRAAQPYIAQAVAAHPTIAHMKIEDGRGRRLGRSFRVKLWPTLIFLKDGKELSRLVRPQNATVITDAMRQILA